ncbi:unnamed protein product [Schistosoma margrebowiei]|uniref:Uncharacterized protein n=1 Tax=Schistosoma margrebowiei TaxID=48269 RepID=A0A183M8U2_9TREM|nr:unnamed protein product [Schistosoma margrebowiei]
MVVGGSRQETLDPDFVLLGTRQQGVPIILRELVLCEGFDPFSPSYLNIVHAMSSHLDWWSHCNMVDSIRSALRRS